MNKKVSYTPLYQQVKNDILNRIISGEWSPGSFLPNEFALAKQYDVSQGTLRKALNELTAEKELVRYQGKGTAVAIVDEDSDLFPFFFLKDRTQKQILPSSHLEKIETAITDEEVAQALNIQKGSEVISLERTRMLEQEAVINEVIYISPAILPSSTKTLASLEIPNTLYAFYQKRSGMRIVRITETIEAEMPSDSDIKRLNISKNDPILLIKRISYSQNDTPIEFRISRVNSNKHIYKYELKQ